MAVLAWPTYALAAITVNTTADLTPAAGECSGGPADCSLRRAIDKAAPGETIVVPAGSYTLSAGQLDLVKSLTIAGAGARTTTVNRDGGTVFHVNSSAPAAISGLTLSAGHETGSSFLHGGALFNETGSVLTLDKMALTGTTLDTTSGSGPTRGAGVMNNGMLTITGSTISDNAERATGPSGGNQGAGLFNSGGTVTITNTTIARNSQEATSGASASGSGISNVGGGDVTLLNVTVSGNSGSQNISTGGSALKMKNTIVANGAVGNCSGTPTSQGHNLESANECALHAGGDLVNKDPVLAPLANNGGPTNTLALASNSPAINAGDGCPATDQRGLGRQGACDIGAFEFVPPAPAPFSRDFLAPGINSARVTKRWRLDSKGPVEVQATRKKRKPAPKGGTFRYTLSENARVVFTIQRKLKGRRVKRKGKRVCSKPTRKNRKKHKCTRYKRFGSFAKQSTAGKNVKTFSGRIGRRKIKPGSYRATLVATDAAGNKSKPKRLTFKVVRR